LRDEKKRSIEAASHLSFLQNLLLNLGRIAEIDAVSEAHVVGAGRIKPIRHRLATEIALLSFPAMFVENDRLVGAGLYAARAAGDTPFCLLKSPLFRESQSNFSKALHTRS